MQVKIAVLDDYQGAALKMADWSGVAHRAQVDVYNDHLADADAVVKRLHPYDIVCVMRERTPLKRGVHRTVAEFEIDRLDRSTQCLHRPGGGGRAGHQGGPHGIFWQPHR